MSTRAVVELDESEQFDFTELCEEGDVKKLD